MATAFDPSVLSNDLQNRTYRWKSDALARWLGQTPPPSAAEDRAALTLDQLAQIDSLPESALRHGLRHRFIDLYLQNRMRAHEAEMLVMTRGAAAHVNGRKIYLREVIPWCQQDHTWAARQQLQKETSALCRFLKPYVLAHWEESLACLRETFDYPDYVHYCQEKKQIRFARLEKQMRHFLAATRPLYFDAITAWCQDHFKRPLADLTRFDAIHLLGWGGCPIRWPRCFAPTDTLALLDNWDMPLHKIAGLHLHLDAAADGAAQAMTLLLRVPQEVHVVMADKGGWIDLETLWHELGHALAAVFTPVDLPLATREFATDHSLSEGYAFLLQGAVLNAAVLTDFLGLDPLAARRLRYYKALRDLAVFRRYAAKFLWELALFNGLDLFDGAPYADLMRQHTGFYHQPESHLFDLTPEFYCGDYLRGMRIARNLSTALAATGGDDWPLSPTTGQRLRAWWARGHAANFDHLREAGQIPALETETFVRYWQEVLADGPPA